MQSLISRLGIEVNFLCPSDEIARWFVYPSAFTDEESDYFPEFLRGAHGRFVRLHKTRNFVEVNGFFSGLALADVRLQHGKFFVDIQSTRWQWRTWFQSRSPCFRLDLQDRTFLTKRRDCRVVRLFRFVVVRFLLRCFHGI